ncbi:DUF5984 family protein [Microbispora sp. NBRC 16548]|uniref:DUF5984 family protein n=1 Tax=Microbispora sp. NBRC 16548 TaxID=3030994 RepID=UPI0024A418C5|nr:DUF5984 family protein [Microbispora sp. NBRC 16548]GLX07134.1 hypothetical protein Misp03_40600 [Microbispora sp. NBRC 16548]
MIRFRFVLTPLGRVAPWGHEDRALHWFELTDGWYWIELADHELLRYTPDTRGQRPYVDYYLARLWEDVIEMTPAVLEPVPADLFDFVAGDPGAWVPVNGDAASTAAVWYDEHTVDLGYIRRPPRIRAWRTVSDDLDVVTVTWRHDDDGDIRFTAPPSGQVVISSDSFLAAVRRFDHELMTAMGRRIRALERTGPPSGIQLDLERLRAEHADRMTWLARGLQNVPETDWTAVRAGAIELRQGLTVRE